jgi:hypothetical protein
MADRTSGLFASPSGEQSALGDPPDSTPPRDTPQLFRGTASYAVRDELQELVRRDCDLLGL